MTESRDAYQVAADQLAGELKALQPQPAQPKGLFVDMIAAEGPEFVEEIAKIGCIQHDCDECKARAAQPVAQLDAAYFYNLTMHALMDVGASHGGCKFRLESMADELRLLMQSAQPVAQPLTLEQILSIVEAIEDTPKMSPIKVLQLLTRAIECAHGIKGGD